MKRAGPVLLLFLVVMLGIPAVRAGHEHASPDPVFGPQRTLVILAELADGPARSDAERRSAKETIANLVFSRLSSLLLEISYNKTGPLVPAGIEGGVTEWLKIPKASSDYYASSGWHAADSLVTDAFLAADEFVNYTGVHRFFVIFASRVPNNIAVNRNPQIQTGEGTIHRAVEVLHEALPLGLYAHELLHAFRIPHWYRVTPDRKFEFTLAGAWSFMSIGSDPSTREGSHDFAWSKIRLGWLPPARLATVASAQSMTVTLDALEVASNGVQAVQIVINNTFSYFVEVRQKIGFDRLLPSKGVLVYSFNALLPECVLGRPGRQPCGPLRLVNARPGTPSGTGGLNNAPFDLGPEQVRVFIDSQLDVKVVVLERQGLAYKILVANGSPTLMTLNEVRWDGVIYPVAITSNSTVYDFAFSQPGKYIEYRALGRDASMGLSQVTIPKALLGGPYAVLVDGQPVGHTTGENATHAILSFSYTHSERTIRVVGTSVIPEFPGPAIAIFLAVFIGAFTALRGRTLLIRFSYRTTPSQQSTNAASELLGNRICSWWD